jgi:hypothetical protein
MLEVNIPGSTALHLEHRVLDVICANINNPLDLLLYPNRLRATLRL